MDIRKYAELNNIVINRYRNAWHIVGYFRDNGQYQPMPKPKWKRIGKKDDTAIRGIDKFCALRKE